MKNTLQGFFLPFFPCQIFLSKQHIAELSVNKSVAYGLIFSQIPFGLEELTDKLSGKASLEDLEPRTQAA